METVMSKSRRRQVVIIFLLAAVVLVTLVIIALPKSADAQVIGHVNQQPVTLERFEEEILLQQVRDRLANRPETEVNSAELLNRMIGDLLLLQEASKAEVTVEQEEVESEVEAVLSRVNTSRSQMSQLLADQGLDWDVFERSILEYMTLRRFQEEVLLVEVSAAERGAVLQNWMSETYSQAEIDFDPEFLQEVNSESLPTFEDQGG
jgi:parvulin-like peptidyl-prolyl isomerase